MIIEQTLSILKPNAVAKKIIGSIYNRFESAGFRIIGVKMQWLNSTIAQEFYIEHKEKPFFNELVTFISSGPIIISILERKNAVQCLRELMGCTDPKYALTGTLRSDYANNITQNTIHGSDSIISAQREINFFFHKNEIFSNTK
ncbi:MAG: nucleoside-diphosphate kinase [Candidatus Dasytiphilus stammeri]